METGGKEEFQTAHGESFVLVGCLWLKLDINGPRTRFEKALFRRPRWSSTDEL